MDFNLRSPPALRASLEASGFHRARRGSGYRHNGLCVTSDHAWLNVQGRANKTAEPLRDQLGKPGLWKTVVERKPKRARREFHLPLSVLAGSDLWADDGEEPTDPLQACLAWAAATARGEVPPGWKSPPREQVEAWVPNRSLVLQSGPLLRQGSLHYAPNRLGLSFPIVNELSADISLARRDWLGEVLIETENRWRMVRVGFDGQADRPAIKAEVDFSGAPHLVLEGLVKAGLDAIRWVVSWSLWSVAFLCDTRVTCRLWEAPTAGIARRKEEEPS